MDSSSNREKELKEFLDFCVRTHCDLLFKQKKYLNTTFGTSGTFNPL